MTTLSFYFQEIKLFGKICNSSIDATVFRYILCFADIINCQHWNKTSQIESLLKTVYPFATVRLFLRYPLKEVYSCRSKQGRP